MEAELVGEASVSAFPQLMVDGLASQEVVDFIKRKDPIKKLFEMLKSAVLLLNAAEEKLIKDQKVKKWLDELKEAVYDADDLVYKIQTELLRKKQGGKSQTSLGKVLMTKLHRSSSTAFDKAIIAETEEILGKLKSLLGQKNSLGLENVETKPVPDQEDTTGSENVETMQPETSRADPLVEESDVYERRADKDAIINKLLSDDASNNKLSVILIRGMSGIGKTTLAHHVYNDEKVTERFNTKAWITVGEDKVDCLKVMKTIIEKVTSEKCEITEPHDLQDKLKKALRTKKFLFVLDDMEDEDPDNWDVLRNSFESGLPGSKIIVTTRSEVVVSIIKVRPIDLKELSPGDAWNLFAKHSLIDGKDPNLQPHGRKIVERCKGLPLAIKSLGGLLRDKQNEKEWLSILNNDIWELCAKSSIGVHPALWLSYHYLPSYLKHCFAYCALFPKDYEFKKGKMILLWMAEGLLNGERMEEVGEEYFKVLISRSFFQPSSEDQSTFVMHGLMHDLAIFVSGEFCFMMDDTNLSDRAQKIRHLSYTEGCHDPRKFEGLSKREGLRTLLALPLSNSCGIWSSHKKQFSMPVEYLLRSLLNTGMCLRVLSPSQHDITKLPDSIGDLKYLRYLDLSHTEIEELPETVCNLYNLQTLLLEGCSRLTRLPTNMGNLINLRHLHTPPYLQEMPLQLSKIKTLQTLSEFVVGKNQSSSLKLLKELQNLKGTLRISGLENAADQVQDVSEAGLKDKTFLSELILAWGFSHAANDSEKEKEVLNALESHENLKKLDIHNYQGSSFPKWVGDHFFKNVVTVRLFNCKKCSSLPPLGQLPSLEHLLIQGFPSVETIDRKFYYSDSDSPITPFKSLKTLLIKEMSNLKQGLVIEGEVGGRLFPHLEKLELRDCPKLEVLLPADLPNLRKLVIYDCNQLKPLLQTADQQNTAFPSLETMSISECDGQKSFLEGGLPLKLKKIIIFGCENLNALDEKAFQQLSSLEKLEISYCVTLERLPKEPPTSLSWLRINNCPLLTPRLQRETGEDWPIIARIKNLDIRSRGL